jgi:hypothetical protein
VQIKSVFYKRPFLEPLQPPIVELQIRLIESIKVVLIPLKSLQFCQPSFAVNKA